MRFVLIDRIVEFEPGKSATGIKNISLSEDFFQEHFPAKPVMPGVLILEGMAQLSGTLLSETVLREMGRRVLSIMTIVDKAKFRKLVYPGDSLRYYTKIETYNDIGGKVKVAAKIDDEIVADAALTFVFHKLVDPELIKMHSDLIDLWLKDPRSDEKG